MIDDEHAIRSLVARWHVATKQGDTATVLSLMSDDALFLTAGREPMTKAEFATLSQANTAGRPSIDIDQQIHEMQISAPLAFMRSSLVVTVTPPDGSATIVRRGQTLTVFKKLGDRWFLHRDANLLAAQPQATRP